jgi:signal transduction histidine kinase/CheY-like chemotaxis protein
MGVWSGHFSAARADRAGRLKRWWLDRPVRTKGLIVVAVPLFALIAMRSASLVLQLSESHARHAAQVTFALGNAADEVLTDSLNAETGIRGYVATRDPFFLIPYNESLARIAADRVSLRDAAAAEGDARKQRAIGATTGRLFYQLAQLRSAVTRGTSAEDLAPAFRVGKATMDLLRSQERSLKAGAAVSLAAQRNATATLEDAIGVLNAVGLVLGLLGGLAGIGLFTAGISRRLATAAANAGRLGAGKPLEPVARSRDELGQLADSLVSAQALLDRRAAELVTARDKALKATGAKNAFLSNTSHELRTPLNSILGFAQLLELSDLSDEDRDSVERILGAGRHLLALINELIDIARIESHELSFSVEQVAVPALVEEVSQLMGPLAAKRSIQIVRQCARPILAAYADRQRLSQVLVNLVSNAIKYNHRGGTVTITCQEEDTGQLRVVVADTGAGIARENLARIFVPFDRLGAEATEIEGTGIGLPLAKALTEAMGGQLSVSSVPDEGSAFTVMLPRAPDMIPCQAHNAVPTSPAAPHARAGATLNILYIEDNPANVEVVSRYLKGRTNVRLQSVASGRAGVEYAMRNPPDIILLDLHLQDIHGDQVLKELKAEAITAAISVVVISADASPGVIRRLLADGATAYLTKPLDLAEFGELLDSFATSAPDHQESTGM